MGRTGGSALSKAKKRAVRALLKFPPLGAAYFRGFEAGIARARHVFIHSITRNIGDLKCCPLEYFEAFQADGIAVDSHVARKYLHVHGAERFADLLRGKSVVFGGGGLIAFERHDTHSAVLEALGVFARKGGTVIVWGEGHNRIEGFEGWTAENAPDFYPPFFEDFALVGVRDAGARYRWVPCASCLHEGFDRPRPAPAHECVAFLHGLESDRLKSALRDVPQMGNISGSRAREPEAALEETLAFLASGETVITNSYHGLYWATLLGRKVIVVPHASKFLSLKHPGFLCTEAEIAGWRNFTGLKSYPHALAECREANRAFYKDAAALMGLAPQGE